MIATNDIIKIYFDTYQLGNWYGYANELENKIILTRFGELEVRNGEGEGHLEIFNNDCSQ